MAETKIGRIDYVTIQEAANLLGVSADTLRRWEEENRFLPDRRTAGGWRLYDRERVKQERFARTS
ncbi:MerR family DNA-binding transcriptional regulator [Acidithiobacillus ferrivorans]|nr:MerR family DNA-binding transcriptional regulator [Acidithiobacillus ferrivorans]